MSLLRRSILPIALMLLFTAAIAAADSPKYSYITAETLEARLNAGQPTVIVDIQVEEDFVRHHIEGAVPTHAYPVKSEEDKQKLAAVLDEVGKSRAPVVIVCPRGGGGAKRTYDYLLAQGVDQERLLILEKGQAGWSCAPLTRKG